MKAISLLYHDVVEGGAAEASGFPGGAAGIYKLERGRFGEHLAAIAAAIPDPPTTVDRLPAGPPGAVPRLLTFDDGGASAYSCIAGMLEQHGWRGHFFITGNRIGTPGFMTGEQVRSLHARGHVIGSHSWSHPTVMTACSDAQLSEEWRASLALLSELTGAPVRVASVPGGHYSRRVARVAAAAGIRALFTSEPTVRCHVVAGCLVLGRFTLWSGASAALAADLAANGRSARLRQWLSWQIKKVLKTVGGQWYLAARSRILDRPHRRRR